MDTYRTGSGDDAAESRGAVHVSGAAAAFGQVSRDVHAPGVGRRPPPLAGVERRLAALATEAWALSGGGYVAGFDVHSVLIADPSGRALVEEASDTIATCFGLVPGMTLARRGGLGGELAAACDLIALSPQPLPFETTASTAAGALLLVRGIALPIAAGADRGKVQAILNWREVLDRAATRRLRRELGTALVMARTGGVAMRPDPFAAARAAAG